MTSHLRYLLSYSGYVLNYFIFSADGDNDEESKRVLKMLQTSVRYSSCYYFDYLCYIIIVGKDQNDSNVIGHFRVALNVCLKARLSGKPLI